jgi:hypothetical protein
MSTTDDSLPRLVHSSEDRSDGTWSFLDEDGNPTDLITAFGPGFWGRITETTLNEQDTTARVGYFLPSMSRGFSAGQSTTTRDRWNRVTISTPAGQQSAWAIIQHNKVVLPISEEESDKLLLAHSEAEVTCTEEQPFMHQGEGGWTPPAILDTELAERCEDGAWSWKFEAEPNPATITVQGGSSRTPGTPGTTGTTVQCKVEHQLELIMGGDPDILQDRIDAINNPQGSPAELTGEWSDESDESDESGES